MEDDENLKNFLNVKPNKPGKVKKHRPPYKSPLQVYDYLLSSDLEMLKDHGSFLVYARPDGERCLL
jgi:hypothetical protein